MGESRGTIFHAEGQDNRGERWSIQTYVWEDGVPTIEVFVGDGMAPTLIVSVENAEAIRDSLRDAIIVAKGGKP